MIKFILPHELFLHEHRGGPGDISNFLERKFKKKKKRRTILFRHFISVALKKTFHVDNLF